MSGDWSDIVGGVGVAIIVVTYLGLQIEKLDAQTYSYSVANILGAVCIIVSLMVNFNLSAFIIEIFWLAISFFGLWRVYRKRRA